MSQNKLIVGLGNPGKQYEFTRHNLGFLAVNNLAKKLNVKFRSCSFSKSLIAETKFNDYNLFLLLPLTYMNLSGIAVKGVLDKIELSFHDILVVCDDLNLDYGQIRLRSKGSDGGHNGLESIIRLVESRDFARLRLGIGESHKGKDSADYVLEEFSKKEKSCIDDFIDQSTECCLAWLQVGISKAMEQFNRRKENGK